MWCQMQWCCTSNSRAQPGQQHYINLFYIPPNTAQMTNKWITKYDISDAMETDQVQRDITLPKCLKKGKKSFAVLQINVYFTGKSHTTLWSSGIDCNFHM